jgi:multidrug efflux pump subunit AcrB
MQNGLNLKLISDDVQYVSSSLKNVWINLLLGAILATLVMFYFLRSARSTLIGVMGIPIWTIAGFLALTAFDRTINVISLAGVAFAIGMTVDNTIVVLESIMQARKRGLCRYKSAVEGVSEVWPAVLASTATTVLVFAPILFIKQEAGQLYSDIAIAITGTIIASMVVAIFVVPVAMANIGKETQASSKSIQPSKKWMHLVDIFCANKKRARMLALSFIVIIIGAAYIVMPAAEYLPEGEEPKAFSLMIAPPSYNLSETEKIGDELRVYFSDYLQASSAYFKSGQTNMPPLAYYSMSVSIGRIWFLSAPVEPQYIQKL